MHLNNITKYYFINKFDTNNIDKQDKKTVIIYRNYYSKKINEDLILKIKNYCKKRDMKFYLSNNIKLAIKLNLDGAYLPSFNKEFGHLSFSLKESFKIIGSAHSVKELRIKEKQDVKKIFLSSLFKKNKNFLGIYKFKLLKKNTKKNLRKLKLINQMDFAGISYFE